MKTIQVTWAFTFQNRKSTISSHVYRFISWLENHHSFHHGTVFAETSMECSNALCMASNTQADTQSAYTCHCLLLIRSQMLLSCANRKLFQPEGVGRGHVWGWGVYKGVAEEGCVFPKKVGGCPRCLLHRASTAHLNIRAPKKLTPDLNPFNSRRTTTMSLLQVIHQTRPPYFLNAWHVGL